MELTFPVPVIVKAIRPYAVPRKTGARPPAMATIVLLDSPDHEVARATVEDLSETGTDVAFHEVTTRIVRLELSQLDSGTALAEIEVIAKGAPH